MTIRYYYENNKGEKVQNELTIEQVEDGDKKKFEHTLPADYRLVLRIPIFDMELFE